MNTQNRQTVAIDDTTQQREPLSWQGDYLIQLAQNITTGAMFGGAIAIVWHWVGNGDLPSTWWLPCLSMGALWCIGWTLARFHGDEIGLFRALYRAGASSRNAEVNALHLQLREQADAMTMAGDAPTAATVQAKQILVAQTTIKHAKLMLQVAFSGDAISRDAMAQRNVGQRDWERAVRLLRAAGVIDELNQLKTRDHRQALKAVEALYSNGYTTMQQRANYRPAWY